MASPRDTLTQLGNGQRVRLGVGDESPLELRLNQREYSPDDRLRLELTADDGDSTRYRLETHVERDAWTPLTLEAYSRSAGSWITVGDVAEATPLETFGIPASDDMKAHGRTGAGGPYR